MDIQRSPIRRPRFEWLPASVTSESMDDRIDFVANSAVFRVILPFKNMAELLMSAKFFFGRNHDASPEKGRLNPEKGRLNPEKGRIPGL
ncbi:hypothetical protein [Pseudomonas amygdali]|uniref:hypothetical protein n=1 Tax=Pseudomonas amygdali TaxID=47877 RepID=UPI00117A4DD8|nr:hypothetical protein [Pseudomonas amygdali]